MLRVRYLVTLLAAVLLVAGCSGEPEEPAPTPEPSVPSGFVPPEGVELTDAGTELALGEPATVVLELGGGDSSAVTVTVERVREGKAADFRMFSLDAATSASTPYYVDVAVRNDGPAGLGGAALPLLAHSDENTLYPASELLGEFEPCPTATVPETFLADAEAELCLIYFLPDGQELQTVDLQPGDQADAVRWQDVLPTPSPSPSATPTD